MNRQTPTSESNLKCRLICRIIAAIEDLENDFINIVRDAKEHTENQRMENDGEEAEEEQEDMEYANFCQTRINADDIFDGIKQEVRSDTEEVDFDAEDIDLEETEGKQVFKESQILKFLTKDYFNQPYYLTKQIIAGLAYFGHLKREQMQKLKFEDIDWLEDGRIKVKTHSEGKDRKIEVYNVPYTTELIGYQSFLSLFRRYIKTLFPEKRYNI